MSTPGSINELLIGAAGAAGAGYEISRSLRFNFADSAYLSRTPASAGNRKTWTLSFWMKLSDFLNRRIFTAGTDGNNGSLIEILGGASPQLRVWNYISGTKALKQTNAVFRDPSAWYYITISCTVSTLKIYINGTEASYSSSTEPDGSDWFFNSTVAHNIGKTAWGSEYLNGYLADIHFIDGQALDPTSFGKFDANGVWQPIEYTGTYGTNGFHLPFSDNSTAAALGTDTSGNSNTWTVNNISVAAGSGNDSLVDSPTNGSQTDTGVGGEVVGNYATLNSLVNASVNSYTNGNLSCAFPGPTANATTFGTIAVSSGKWYWEGTRNDISQGLLVGIARIDANPASLIGSQAISYAYKETNGNKINNGISTAYGTTGAHVGVGLDLDAGTLTFYVNGVSQGVAFSGISGTFFPAWSEDSAGGGSGVDVNFGQRPFAYTAPSGYKALCTTNLPAPVVAQPSTVMDVKLYTGNGSTQTISGLGFSPDLVWLKRRDNGVYAHSLVDTVRGAGLRLSSNSTSAEDAFDAVTAFTSDGFTLGNTVLNDSATSSVAWAWDAGSSTVSNPDGSITSSVRANASAGFSIVTYTGNNTAGATVGHGLGVAPQFIIVKSRSDAYAWQVGHTSIGWTARLSLNTTAAASTTSIAWNDTAPTSTVFTAGDSALVNGPSYTYVAYCFAPVDGYSSFGSYTGNGSADGPFVFTGMRPKYILLKRTDAVEDWAIRDTSRSPFNASTTDLAANQTYGDFDSTSNSFDILSNGFKPRNTRAMYNASGGTYVWAAFAENPFQYARAR